MKTVLLINGSPHADGTTRATLDEVGKGLAEYGVQTEIFHIGTKPVYGCTACRKCLELGRCVLDDDPCNELARRIKASDGIVVGSPVYYAGPNGALCALLDRVFFSAARGFAHKPAAAVAVCRRGGASAALDRLNKYFTISQMPVVSSQYWNMVHGACAEDAAQDLEGMQVMRVLGRNMAWMLENFERGGAPLPEREKRAWTNFVR